MQHYGMSRLTLASTSTYCLSPRRPLVNVVNVVNCDKEFFVYETQLVGEIREKRNLLQRAWVYKLRWLSSTLPAFCLPPICAFATPSNFSIPHPHHQWTLSLISPTSSQAPQSLIRTHQHPLMKKLLRRALGHTFIVSLRETPPFPGEFLTTATPSPFILVCLLLSF